MDNQNRYEEVPQKENKFVKGLKAFGRYWKFVFLDFFRSFKYNNMKLSAILFALPGILLGFFMFAHVPTIRKVTVFYDTAVEGTEASITSVLNSETPGDLTDYTLTLSKYTVNGTDYENIKLVKYSYEELKEKDSKFDQNLYPIDGYSESASKTKTFENAFVPSLTQKDADNFSFSVKMKNGEDLVEVPSEVNAEIAYYAIFIYVPASNTFSYYFSNAYRTATITDSSVNVAINVLTPGDYKVAVKAVARAAGEYYSSPMSEKVDFTVSTKGTAATNEDYDENDFKYAALAGEYYVKDATGDLANFTVDFAANGFITYNVQGGKSVTAKVSGSISNLDSIVQKRVYIIPFDFSGMAIFFLTLLGFLNVFVSLDLSKKKNLGSVVKAGLLTLAIVGIGALYIYSIYATEGAVKSGGLKLNGVTTILDKNATISIVVVILAAVFSLAGLVLAFINYDRTYEKVDR